MFLLNSSFLQSTVFILCNCFLIFKPTQDIIYQLNNQCQLILYKIVVII